VNRKRTLITLWSLVILLPAAGIGVFVKLDSVANYQMARLSAFIHPESNDGTLGGMIRNMISGAHLAGRGDCEKIKFFKENSGKISMEYNAISGKLVLTDGESQKEYQRDLPGFDSYGVYDISEEDIQRVKDSLDSVSSKNKEVSIKVMLKVRGERQMCDLKLHTLWSSLKTDGYIGIVGQLDIVK